MTQQNGSTPTTIIQQPASGTIAVPQADRFNELIRTGKPGEFMSYDATLPEYAIMHIEATLGKPKDLSELTNMEIAVSNFLLSDASRETENGQIEEWKRIVIFDDKNVPYSCGSKGIAKSLAVLFPIRGPMPWNPPLLCKVKVEKLSGTRIWMTLQPDMPKLLDQLKALRKAK